MIHKFGLAIALATGLFLSTAPGHADENCRPLDVTLADVQKHPAYERHLRVDPKHNELFHKVAVSLAPEAVPYDSTFVLIAVTGGGFVLAVGNSGNVCGFITLPAQYGKALVEHIEGRGV